VPSLLMPKDEGKAVPIKVHASTFRCEPFFSLFEGIDIRS
jgi:hypothetical protein